MAWEDKPTKKQLDALWNFMTRHIAMPNKKANIALEWLEKNATRKQVSDELGRVRDLGIDNKLTPENIFASDVWANFKYNEDEMPTEKQTSLVFAIINKILPFKDAVLASHWLKFNSTKQQVAIEIDRLKDLQDNFRLDQESCFDSEIWSGYVGKEVG